VERDLFCLIQTPVDQPLGDESSLSCALTPLFTAQRAATSGQPVPAVVYRPSRSTAMAIIAQLTTFADAPLTPVGFIEHP